MENKKTNVGIGDKRHPGVEGDHSQYQQAFDEIQCRITPEIESGSQC
jgi:hypothetical protein